MTPVSILSRSLPFLCAAALSGSPGFAQTPATPAPAAVKPIPPPGVAIPDGDREELQAGVVALGKDITILRHNLQAKPELIALLPDVMIFHKAVDWALRYDEFFNVKQVATAKKLLELGNQRLSELKEGKPSWTSATGLVPRGYISKIDGSVQPYGMVIPDDWKPGETTPRRLDFWCHGRGENLSELSFLDQRLTQKGEFTPPGVLVLHLYGRFCCANKFAGESDLFEALENAKTHYKIDPNKLVVRGFSMGGGAAWQFATHFAGQWAAVQPGAGFADTREFMKLGPEFAKPGTPEKPLPPEWEQKLWAWYDSKDYVANLANTTTVAYSGEIDGQKAAADVMIRSAREDAGNAHPVMGELNKVNPGDGSSNAAEARVTGTAPDVAFYHVIGLQVPHKIKPEAKPEVDKLVDEAVAKHEAVPKKVRFTTYSLVYPKMDWITVRGMDKQWERADVTGEILAKGVKLATKNVTEFEVSLPPETFPMDSQPELLADGAPLKLEYSMTAGPARWYGAAQKADGKWTQRIQFGLSKNPWTCGPIDHAFMKSFVFVRPTGAPLNEKVGAWAKGELDHAEGFWRKVFRGDAPVKDDTEISDSEIATGQANLVLWGDPSSNKVLAKLLPKLPLQWSKDKLVFAGQTYDAAHTAPVMIFPNPLNKFHYIVINSGPTFRELALLNNADQTSKLPDWAIIDLNTPPDAKWPGEVKAAGFFDEQWKAPGK